MDRTAIDDSGAAPATVFESNRHQESFEDSATAPPSAREGEADELPPGRSLESPETGLAKSFRTTSIGIAVGDGHARSLAPAYPNRTPIPTTAAMRACMGSEQ